MSRRKSKWDIPAEPVSNSNNGSSSNSAVDAAKERAAKLTAMLAAKGKLANNTAGAILPVPKPVIGVQPLPKIDKEQDLITAELEINDSPSRYINIIIQLNPDCLKSSEPGNTINRYSGAAVSTKGRFMDANERLLECNEGIRPLYLCIQGTSQDKVDRAVQRIQEIMAGSDIFGATSKQSRWSSYQPTTSNPVVPQSITDAIAAQASSTAMHYVQDKVFVGLDSTCSPDFNVKEKLIGPAGSYFQHITTETGAKVFLRGKGSGFLEPTSGREAFEALHIYISHAKPEGLSAAKKLVENLIQTVKNEYQSFEQMRRAQQSSHIPQQGLPPPGYMPPMGYPPRIAHPPRNYPGPPLPPGGYYRHPPPAGPMKMTVPYPMPPRGHGPPSQPRPPSLPREHSNGGSQNYPGYPPAPPDISPYPPRPLLPPTHDPSNNGSSHIPERRNTELQHYRERSPPREAPRPAAPPPEPPKRRFKEATRNDISQETQPRLAQDTQLRQESPRQPSSHLGHHQEPTVLMPPPPLMNKQKNNDSGFKKPFLAPPPPRELPRKNTEPIESLGNTRKHGLSKTSDESVTKKAKKEDTSPLMSLVAYDGDSSDEEEFSEPIPTNNRTQASKPAVLPFWAISKK